MVVPFVLIVLLVLLAVAPGIGVRPARAQGPTAWIAPGAGVLWIPNELGVEPNRPMFGGIIGVALSPSWALEARGIFASSDAEPSGGATLNLLHASGDLTWFLRQ